jgi:predicted ATP-grasp superfamily ATP-dependent carboligase
MPSVTVLRSPTDLRILVAQFDDHAAAALMLQEYIPGDAESVRMFNGYVGRNGHLLAGFTGRKVRQYPSRTGMTCLGVCQREPAVELITERFLGQLGYRGVVDMGYRFDERDNQFKLLDVNPRVGATFRLFVDTQGLDVLRALYLDLTGQTVPASEGAKDGRRWVVEHHDLFTAVSLMRDGSLRPRDWVRSVRDVRELAWCALDDPRPVLSLVWHSLRRGPRVDAATTASVSAVSG